MMAPSTLVPSGGPPWPARFSVPQVVATDRYGDRVLALDADTGGYVILRGTSLTASRFVRIAPRLQLLAETTHPKLAPLVGFGHEQEHLWIATQYLVGRSANEVLAEQGRLLLHEFVPIAAQVLMGLGHLHQRGIAVGAIRPEDVMLREHRGRGLVVTLHDVGAHGVLPIVIDDETARAELFAEMAPEHASLDAVPTVESDVFALGVLFHRLLAGTSPFVRAPANGRELGVIARQAPRVDAGLPADHGVPEGLVVLVQQLLAADPRDRPHDANDVVERMIDCVPKALFRLPSRVGIETPEGSGTLFLTGRFAALTRASSSTALPVLTSTADMDARGARVSTQASATTSEPGLPPPVVHARGPSWPGLIVALAAVLVVGIVAVLAVVTYRRGEPSRTDAMELAPAAVIPSESEGPAPRVDPAREAEPASETSEHDDASPDGANASDEGRVVIEVERADSPERAARKPRPVHTSTPPSPPPTEAPARERPVAAPTRPTTAPAEPSSTSKRPAALLDVAEERTQPKKRSDDLLPVNEDR